MSGKKDERTDSVLARNKKAYHDYEILDKIEAGIELKGTEVKSCRAGNISLVDTYAKVEDGEMWLYNAHIAPYDHGNRYNHPPCRQRRLLLRKREILKMAQQTKEKGLTITPTRFYLKNGRVKVELALCKGRTRGDKREALRRKEDTMAMKRAMAR